MRLAGAIKEREGRREGGRVAGAAAGVAHTKERFIPNEAGDVNRDGVCDGYDPQDWDDYNDYGAGALAVDLDVNRDGVVDIADRALVQGHADWLLWTSHGRGSVSRLHNRRGYAGGRQEGNHTDRRRNRRSVARNDNGQDRRHLPHVFQ